MGSARLAVDIGGTFTDFALEVGERRFSAKVLTTPRAPDEAVLAGADLILADAGIGPADLGLVVHGTTLATNAIIERKGARTALLVTRGFRDSVEMAYENRFEQYDILMRRPEPLVPRHLRLPVPERMDARGRVVEPLDEAAVGALVPVLRREGVESVAIGFLHAYRNPAHEERAGAILAECAPDLAVTLSSEVSPEMREYERFSTACANAYVQPAMAGYLARLETAFRARGLRCPLYLITSAGGLTALDTARRFPIRLVESGPAGGAILAASIARQRGDEAILSFDMGGTTAKICLIDGAQPPYSRSFEVARQYRFLKGSGLPVRVPVVEMVEIGAGGGSLARVDALSRLLVGPESAGSEPGPACYGRGGSEATVTDADLLLGRLRADRFAGGRIPLDAEAARRALAALGEPLGLDPPGAALGLSEVVEENMANAARVHAVERGQELGGRTMIAFGGAAPLHAARLARKLGIGTVVIPRGAGVGSALGFLLAPVAYEVVRSRYARLDRDFDPAAIEALRGAMRAEAEAVVRAGAPGAALTETWSADMRYRGQGHEVGVPIPAEALGRDSAAELSGRFEARYAELFGRSIPGLDVEVMSWSLRLAAPTPEPPPSPARPAERTAVAAERVALTDPAGGGTVLVALHDRDGLAPGDTVPGPALIVEDETTTLVGADFVARVDGAGSIVMTRR